MLPKNFNDLNYDFLHHDVDCQPDWDEVNKLIAKGLHHFYEIAHESGWVVVIATDKQITLDEAKSIYEWEELHA